MSKKLGNQNLDFCDCETCLEGEPCQKDCEPEMECTGCYESRMDSLDRDFEEAEAFGAH